MASDSFMLLEEHQLMPLLLSISDIMETQTVINGLHLLEKESALIQEDLTLKQVNFIFISAAGMKLMFLDKHGATSVLSAFETVVK